MGMRKIVTNSQKNEQKKSGSQRVSGVWSEKIRFLHKTLRPVRAGVYNNLFLCKPKKTLQIPY